MASILAGKAGIALITAAGIATAVGVGVLVRDKEGQSIISTLLSPAPQQAAQPADPEPQPENSQAESGQQQGDRVAGLSTDEPAASAQPAAPETAMAVEPQPPVFDILRVEPDGSVVVAGKAIPQSRVEILSGDAVVGSGAAGPLGDFAIVFDTPLSVGDHVLLIRSLPEGGPAILSEEAGIVSIPDSATGEGEVLAMVSREGAASRILQGPGSDAQADTEQADSGQSGSGQSESGQATAEPQEQASAAEPVQSQEETSEPSTQAASEPAAQETVEPTAEAATQQNAETPAQPPAEKAVAQPVLVQAVDVEPDRMFIAGTGEPGASVRIYIDEKFLGRTTVTPQGSFLLELQESLVPGRHDLRADMVTDASGDVAARAQIFIDHQPEQVASTADNVQQATQEQAAEQAGGTVQTDTGTSSGQTVAQASDGAAPADATQQAVATQSARAVQEPASEPSGGSTSEPSATSSGEVKVASADPAAVDSAEDQRPVIRTGRSVIIRRGDNLWRISRRMLGEGRRYTLIFEANTDQIRDPDLIFPGQVFEVPDEAPQSE